MILARKPALCVIKRALSKFTCHRASAALRFGARPIRIVSGTGCSFGLNAGPLQSGYDRLGNIGQMVAHLIHIVDQVDKTRDVQICLLVYDQNNQFPIR